MKNEELKVKSVLMTDLQKPNTQQLTAYFKHFPLPTNELCIEKSICPKTN